MRYKAKTSSLTSAKLTINKQTKKRKVGTNEISSEKSEIKIEKKNRNIFEKERERQGR
jgi:hypothetical protein